MKKNLMMPLLVVCFSLFASSVMAKVEKVELTGTLKGIKKSSVIVYDFSTKKELGEGSVVNGSLNVSFQADTRGQKCFLYISKFDDKKSPNQPMTRFFFADNKNINVSGKVRIGGLRGFKQSGSFVYDQYIGIDDQLDNEAYSAAIKKVVECDNNTQACLNALRKKNFASKKRALEDDMVTQEINMYAKFLKGLTPDQFNEGIDAMIYEKISPFRYSYIEPFMEIYNEKKGASYETKSLYYAKLLDRYRIISMYREGTPVFDARLVDMNNEAVHISDFKGKNVYMCLWDFDHAASGSNVETIREMAKKCKKTNTVFLVVNINPSLVKWNDIAKDFQHDNVMHVSMDKNWEKDMNIQFDNTFSYVYKTKKYPRAILIDEDQKMKNWSFLLPDNAGAIKALKKAL